MLVPLLTVKVVAAVPPKLTAVAPLKFVPVIVTVVAPVVRPVFGLTLVTAGAGVGVGVPPPAVETVKLSTRPVPPVPTVEPPILVVEVLTNLIKTFV
jgi:hypothetical protein